MRAVALAALVVAVAAVASCGDDEPAKPRSRDEAVAACTRAIDDVVAALMNKVEGFSTVADSRLAARIACAGLYRRPGCARAWTSLATVGSAAAERRMSVEEVTAACAKAYCGDLDEPRPRGCAEIPLAIGDRGQAAATLQELDRRILAFEGVAKPAASALARRALLFAPVTFERNLAIDQPGLPRPARPFVEVRITAATVQVDGAPVDDAGLRAKVAAAVANDPEVTIMITADPTIPYARVVETMDLIKAAGGTKIAFSVP